LPVRENALAPELVATAKTVGCRDELEDRGLLADHEHRRVAVAVD